ncbi:MAG: GNAT family N-acetyltransferase [Pseudomonadota bacterium]
MSIIARAGLEPVEPATSNNEAARKTDSPSDATHAKARGIWRIDTLKTAADIRKHAYQWLDLERRSADPNAAFQGYVWCEAWLSVYCRPDSGIEPRVFFIYFADTLVAVLPMMVQSHMGARVLTNLGEPHSQLANALCDVTVDCTDGLRLCISQAALLAQADVMALGPLPARSPLVAVLGHDVLTPDPAEYISLIEWPTSTTSESYLQSLSKNKRKTFNKKYRRLTELGEVEFKRLGPQDTGFRPAIEQALKLKREWLRREGLYSLGLTYTDVDQFLTSFVAHDGAFHIEAETVHVDGSVLSICINLVGNGVRHCYLSAYDDALAEHSPGTIGHQISVQHTIDDSLQAYSFLGYPTRYKAVWSNAQEPLLRYQLALNAKGATWLRCWTNGLRPLAKRLMTVGKGVMRLLNGARIAR